MTSIVFLTSPDADARARGALSRALERLPARVEPVPFAARAARLFALAAQDVTWIGIVDRDVLVRADAFGSLRRWLDSESALIGGRAVIGTQQWLGAMFAAPRSGPDPFELAALTGVHNDRVLSDAVRGPIDACQRGLVLVSGAFLRSLGECALDPDVLPLDLAVHARRLGRAVVCEPSMTFASDAESVAVRRAYGRLRRFFAVGSWRAADLHREPPVLRETFTNREVRVMGDVRGFERRPLAPIDVLVAGGDDVSLARAQREARALRSGGSVTAIGDGDGDAVRAALGRTGDRLLLVAHASSVPSRAGVLDLVERLESTSRLGAALDDAGNALFHLGRVVNPQTLSGATVRDVVAASIDAFPARRLFVSTRAGTHVPQHLAALAPLASVDVILVAASRPEVTGQTLQALVKERVEGTTSVIYPAGATTTSRLLHTYSGLTLIADGTDPHLAPGLNQALGASRSDAVLIVRDDVQLPLGIIPRLRDAFRRIPRLGIAVPRVGGASRPEGLPDLGYRNSGDMQSFANRRGNDFAREAMLMDIATTPVLLTTREVLDVVGGFDERFAFSRVGIEDFARRVRAANFRIARCDDAYAHIFPPGEAMSFLASIDDDAALRAAFEARWATRDGFRADRDRIPLRDAIEPVAPSSEDALHVLLPVATDAEWASTAPLLADLASAFRADDALNVVIGLDGEYGLQSAVSAVREVLASVPVPLEQTLNIRIEAVGDLDVWRDAERRSVRASRVERAALDVLPAIDGSTAVRALLTRVHA